MMDRLADSLHKVLSSKTLESVSLVRVPRDMARRLNRLVGSPVAPLSELEKRRAAAQKLAELRSQGGEEKAAAVVAPVVVYIEKDRNERELGRVKELLDAKDIPYTLADVTGDAATLAFVMNAAKCEKDQLPVVFVAGEPIGRYNDVVAADVAGKLEKLVFGAAGRTKAASAHAS
jgi:glutaredoxin